MDEPSFDIDDELEIQEAMEREAQTSQEADNYEFDCPEHQEECQAVTHAAKVVHVIAPSIPIESCKATQVVSIPTSFAR